MSSPLLSPFFFLRRRVRGAVYEEVGSVTGHEGTEVEPRGGDSGVPPQRNGMFRVKLDNEDVILGYISGNIRKNFIRMLPGDKVKIEVSRYDSTRGRIVYRMRNRDSPSAD